jgi:ZIP family zinc transporter/zinc and cadmium transporter
MMNGPALACTVVAALANVGGAAAVTSRARWSTRALDMMIAFSGGFMISVVLLDMVPEALRQNGPSAAWIILAGYVLVHLTQHTLAPHFHFGEETHHVTRVTGVSALIGLLVHTFVDGVAIVSGFGAGTKLGTLVLVAIMLHKLPEGSAISSLFMVAGLGRGRALAAAAALGVATILGALFTESFALLSRYGLAISAGVTIYVAASNLVPEFQHKGGWRLPSMFFAGCAVYLTAHQLLAV